jgi:hypothetical protein
MKYINKHFNTLKEAERYLNKLYNKYHHVIVIKYPLFSENGIYIFEIN